MPIRQEAIIEKTSFVDATALQSEKSVESAMRYRRRNVSVFVII